MEKCCIQVQECDLTQHFCTDLKCLVDNFERDIVLCFASITQASLRKMIHGDSVAATLTAIFNLNFLMMREIKENFKMPNGGIQRKVGASKLFYTILWWVHLFPQDNLMNKKSNLWVGPTFVTVFPRDPQTSVKASTMLFWSMAQFIFALHERFLFSWVRNETL